MHLGSINDCQPLISHASGKSALVGGTANKSSLCDLKGPRRALSDALTCPPPGLGPLQNFDLANFISAPWYAQAMVSSAPPGKGVRTNMLPGLRFMQDAIHGTWRVRGNRLMSVMSLVLRWRLTELIVLQQPTFYQPATTLFCFCTLYKPTDSTDLMVGRLAWHITI